MIAYEIFAQVVDGEIKNISIFNNYQDADYITKCTYGAEARAVDCLQYRVTIGDKYHDGCFYRVDENGAESPVEYVPTEAQEIESLKAVNDELTLALAELLGGVEA